MQKITLILLLAIPYFGFSQVGIGNENPKATLDITANQDNPNNNEGILIPRISNFPQTNPTIDQDGMLVFLNEEVNMEVNGNPTTFSRGFYYWNNELSQWSKIDTGETENFQVMETSAAPTSIHDNVYRMGRVSLGQINQTAQLSAIVNNNNTNLTNKPRIALYAQNRHPSTGASYHTFGIDVINESSVNGLTYGIRVRNTTSTSNTKFGIHNTITIPGTGMRVGIHNEVSQGGTSTAEVFGIRNIVGRTYGLNSSKYGIFSEIGSSSSVGPIFGIYSKAEGNGASPVFAGYFLGNVSIGTTNANNYILPASRGNEGEVMVAQSNGNITWRPGSTRDFTTIDQTQASFTVTVDMSTIRITENVNDINLPDPSIVPGKVFTFTKIAGLLDTQLTVSGGAGSIYDDVLNSEITQIGAAERLTLQSDGFNYIVIGN